MEYVDFLQVEYAIYLEARYQDYVQDCERFDWVEIDREGWFDSVHNFG